MLEEILIRGAERHEKLFPLADLGSQVLKLEEEILEAMDAESEEQLIKEIADCLICCWGIYRFTPRMAKILINSVVMKLINGYDDIKKAVDYAEEKWKINEGREWIFDPLTKKYKHKGVDGYE